MSRTHCAKGHLYTPETSYPRKTRSGHVCLTCQHLYNTSPTRREAKARHRAAAREASPRTMKPWGRTPINQRFWDRLVRQENGCWDWPAGTGVSGYGLISYEGRSTGTHRLAWQLTNGPIPEGMFVLHHCDNRRCCNPDHLFVGTHTDNMRDMHAKGRWLARLSDEAAG